MTNESAADDGDIDSRLLEACARASHEANRALCIAYGDLSQDAWNDAPEWQRASARHGVAVALAGASPAALHESWRRVRAADGWVFGEVKDPAAKTHPCMVPYAELPAAQQAKDALYGAVVRAMAAALDGGHAKATPEPELTKEETTGHHVVERVETVLWVAIAADGYTCEPFAAARSEDELLTTLWLRHAGGALIDEDGYERPDGWRPNDTVIAKVPTRFVVDNHVDAVDLTTRRVDWGHADWNACDNEWINRVLAKEG